jgi:hypothetical protein
MQPKTLIRLAALLALLVLMLPAAASAGQPMSSAAATDAAILSAPEGGGQCPAGPVNGELTSSSPTYNRTVNFGSRCVLTGIGTNVHYAVHSYFLSGPAPHDLFASVVGGTTVDTIMVFYQAPDGSANPFNPAQPCVNSVGFNAFYNGGLQSAINRANLAPGWIDVVLTTYFNGATGPYTMQVSSQSCGGGLAEIDVSPLSLASTQATNTVTSQMLDIGNAGDALLTWAVGEEPGGGAPTALRQGEGGVLLSEGFDSVAALPGLGWHVQNNSSPLGATTWGQGVVTANTFPAQAGAPTAFAAVGGSSTTAMGTASVWLLTPELPLDNGYVFSFYTRTLLDWLWADRLEVRLSTAGASTNVGTLASDVGDFSRLLLTVNPTLAQGGYPMTAWAHYSLRLNGIAPGATGRLAFRYYVTEAGNSTAAANNGAYIGLDTVEYVSGAARPCDLPADVPWLSVLPDNGTTAAGGSSAVDVTFDSTGLAPGEYSSYLCISNNDRDAGPGNGTDLVILPVSLMVADPTAVTLSGLSAAQASLPAAGLPVAALPALAGLALGAAYAVRRRQG